LRRFLVMSCAHAGCGCPAAARSASLRTWCTCTLALCSPSSHHPARSRLMSWLPRGRVSGTAFPEWRGHGPVDIRVSRAARSPVAHLAASRRATRQEAGRNHRSRGAGAGARRLGDRPGSVAAPAGPRRRGDALATRPRRGTPPADGEIRQLLEHAALGHVRQLWQDAALGVQPLAALSKQPRTARSARGLSDARVTGERAARSSPRVPNRGCCGLKPA